MRTLTKTKRKQIRNQKKKDQTETSIIFFVQTIFHYMIKNYGHAVYFFIYQILNDKIKKKLLKITKGEKTKKTYSSSKLTHQTYKPGNLG